MDRIKRVGVFRQAFTLEINGDKLPAEQTQALLEELQALFAKFHASEALKVKEGIKPVRCFTAQESALLAAGAGLWQEKTGELFRTIPNKKASLRSRKRHEAKMAGTQR